MAIIVRNEEERLEQEGCEQPGRGELRRSAGGLHRGIFSDSGGGRPIRDKYPADHPRDPIGRPDLAARNRFGIERPWCPHRAWRPVGFVVCAEVLVRASK